AARGMSRPYQAGLTRLGVEVAVDADPAGRAVLRGPDPLQGEVARSELGLQRGSASGRDQQPAGGLGVGQHELLGTVEVAPVHAGPDELVVATGASRYHAVAGELEHARPELH